MTAITLTVVFLASIYFITKPLFSLEYPEYKVKDSDAFDLETVFLTLNELEFDYKTGKLSLRDYEKLSGKYKLMGADLLQKEENKLKGNSDYDKIKEDTEMDIEAFISQSQKDKK